MPAKLQIKPRRHKYGAKPQWLLADTVYSSRADVENAVAAIQKRTGEAVKPLYFASKKELKCWLELCERQRRGEIRDLKRQVRFELKGASGKVIESYVADYEYMELIGTRESETAVTTDWAYRVADAKGRRTEAYKRKRKWMKSELNIDIVEL